MAERKLPALPKDGPLGMIQYTGADMHRYARQALAELRECDAFGGKRRHAAKELPFEWHSIVLIAQDRKGVPWIRVNPLTILAAEDFIQALIADRTKLAREAYSWWEALQAETKRSRSAEIAARLPEPEDERD